MANVSRSCQHELRSRSSIFFRSSGMLDDDCLILTSTLHCCATIVLIPGQLIIAKHGAVVDYFLSLWRAAMHEQALLATSSR